jgi:hypothetical protein
MTAQREWTFGTIRVSFEPPELVVAKFLGPTTGLEEARSLVHLYRELGSQRPFFLIVDMAGATLDKAARDYLTQHLRLEWLLGVVYVGAGLVQKVVTRLMAFAVSLAAGKSSLDFLFAQTEAKARALYERKRRELAARVS